MKAALHFDSVQGFGEWRILISTRADRDLRQARRKNTKLFKIIVKKIKELSNGHFSDDNQKRLTGLDVEVPIYEAKMTGDTRLVYQVDCVSEFESDIFGVYTHAKLDRRFWDCMGRQLERKGTEYKKRCMFRNPPMNPGDNVYMPAFWPPPVDVPTFEPVSGITDMRKEDYEELHSLLVLEKFVTFSQALLNSIIADKDVAHVFEISLQEKRIIEHPSSCYVLGRSGTGKTTTMLFKMLGIQRAWELHREIMPKPRQLFVTQSRVLAEKVEEYFTKLLESLATAGRSPSELKSLVERQKHQQEQGLVDRDEEIYWRGDLPKRYGALKEEHFPMFLTYDHVCRLLESEFRHIERDIEHKAAVSRAIQDAFQLQEPDGRDNTLSNDYMQQRRDRFVSFGTFLEEYWSHFPQALTKGLDPTLVFGEFMGVIKGSEPTLECAEGYLTKDMYFGLSHRTQGTFANQRETVYALFETYLKKKKARGDYDAADSYMPLVCLESSLHHLIVIVIGTILEVLRTLCSNPHGMFWAGDTAQTISVGSAFRFNDLKAFLYRVEEANAGGNTERRTQPESFHLAVNYRSHAGIVDCAHSVIELITQFWPHAIDALAPEQGMIHGLKPVFFSGWDQDTARYEQFLFGEAGSHIEFGAEQCILVRDEAARDRLRALVLLYNFFEDSTTDLSQWRVVLNALPEAQRANHPAPRFDDARHGGVCRELKFLYVAITRARKNLWIADGSTKGEPMRLVWTQKDQIQNCTPGTDVPRLAMSSTAEDWAKTALSLFNNRRYMQAMHCYERAGLSRERAVANAYYLRELARTRPISRGDTSSRVSAFLAAAHAFVASAQKAVTEKSAYYRIAAQCYVDAGSDYEAAWAYAQATEYTLAAQYYRKAGKFEEAVEIIKTHKDRMQPEVVESIVDVSRLYFLREKQVKKAMELFESENDALEYMDDFGLDLARAQFLEDTGRLSEAADVHLSEGNMLEAIRVLSMDGSNETSLKRALDCLLEGLWRNLSCGVPVNEDTLRSNAVLRKLLLYAKTMEGVSGGDELLRDQVFMFTAITKHDVQQLLILAKKLSVSEATSPAAFICLDRVFSVPLNLQTATSSQVVHALQTFHQYACMLQKLCSVKNPCDDPTVRKVFALQAITEDSFLVPKGAILAAGCDDRLTPSAQETEQGVRVNRWELEKLIIHVLKLRLRKRVKEEDEMCYGLQLLQPCLPHAVFHQCNRTNCARIHIESKRYDAAAYHTRIRIHILQILIYQTLHAVEDFHEHARHRRHWLRRLYDALYPPYYKLGSIHLLSSALIPEFTVGGHVIKSWVNEHLYSLSAYQSNAFITNFIQGLRLAFVFDANNASEYVYRTPAVMTHRPSALMRSGETNVYIVHYVLDSMQNSDISALNKGVLFMNHILENRVPIDIGVLCDFMDHLCGSLLAASRLRATGNLHGLMLPKSWLLRLVAIAEVLRVKDTQLVKIYKSKISELLEPLYTGQGAVITADQFRYVTARSWDRLARVVRHSVEGSGLDEMVQLRYGPRSEEQGSTYDVRHIVYNRLEDIPRLLRTEGSIAGSADHVGTEAIPIAPPAAPQENAELENNEDPATAEDDEEDTAEQAVDAEHVAQAIDSDYTAAAPTAPTAEEIIAATTIAEAYRQHILRKEKRVKRKSSEEVRRRIFESFLAEAERMEWPHRYYRMLFLGPIPHLYIVVESMKNHLHEARSSERKRFNIVRHLELEKVQSALTQLNQSFKVAMALFQALAPASEVHKRRDLDKLKAHVSEVEALMRSLPAAITGKWESDMQIALRGIVQVAKPPVKQSKPDLNVEDLVEY
ncbi:hypothetical protein BD311DRAFT_674657 [Dichomitus squalens]|uniref:P-loop containing nucleoside triphosphate hydrolase protein n=1 Tax=Dichomitus squalens TaxID=114155 RepID=A0A4Q9M7W4_9APHY|nr:hypothetical protein BD311DRAFT_674657 [Dichomitus squalens]